MEKQPSLDQILIQIQEILQMVQNHKKVPSSDLSPQVLNDLERIESAMKTLSHYHQEGVQEAQLNMDHLIQETQDSVMISSREKQFLKRAQGIEKDVQAFHSALSQAIEKENKRSKNRVPLKDETSRQQQKERRKLFKPLGGDKSWIPL